MASIPARPAAAPEPRGLRHPISREEWRKFANWLVVWVILANVVFAGMWLVGSPPRSAEIFIAGAIGLLVRDASSSIRAAAFLAVMCYSALSFVAGLFNLKITSLLYSIRFFLEIDPRQSLEYIVGAALLLVICSLAIWRMRRPQGFANFRLVLLAIAITLSFSLGDWIMGENMRGHYMRAAATDAPFVSATARSGFAGGINVPKRHLLLIMVESLGSPLANAEMDRLMFAQFQTPSVTNKFDLSMGETTYYNSTTSGEIRELCGRWGDYYEVIDSTDTGCLPARLAAAGYRTRAYHSFSGAFFDRTRWYPNIGFQQSSFAEHLFKRGVRACGGVFPGACDRDVPALLARDLKAAQSPQFVYWLTLNSHLPVPPGMNLKVDRCERVSPELARDYPMICRQFALWAQLDRAIVKEIAEADFPATDILIVGDHMPPYFDRHHRSQFAPDRVPWLLLKWKEDPVDPTGAADLAKTGEPDVGFDG